MGGDIDIAYAVEDRAKTWLSSFSHAATAGDRSFLMAARMWLLVNLSSSRQLKACMSRVSAICCCR